MGTHTAGGADRVIAEAPNAGGAERIAPNAGGAERIAPNAGGAERIAPNAGERKTRSAPPRVLQSAQC
jgi:hypothetical protein